MLGQNQRNTLYKFLDVTAQMLAEKLNVDDLPSLLNEVNLSLVKLEKDMPMTIHVSIYLSVCIFC